MTATSWAWPGTTSSLSTPCSPLGFAPPPKIFKSVADALQWIARAYGITYLEHFLDDFITTGAPGSEECSHNLSLLVYLCALLNIPLAMHTQEGPSTCLIFLGIELDTEKLELRLQAKKLERLQRMLKRWSSYKSCQDSLVGYLHDASIVVRPGRTFVRRLIDLPRSHHHRPAIAFIRLNAEARSDIQWWHSFIQHWNGLSMMQQSRRDNPDIVLTSDASGSWGCGAFCGTAWFQYQWPTDMPPSHITLKELLPIVIAAAVWGGKVGKQIHCVQMRQRSCCLHSQYGFKQRPCSHGLDALLTFYHCQVQSTPICSAFGRHCQQPG